MEGGRCEMEGSRRGGGGSGQTDLCILDDQVAGRLDEGHQGGGKKHLDDGDIAFVAVEDLGEGLGVVDAEAFGGADGQAAVVLVEGDEVECAARHGGRSDAGWGLREREWTAKLSKVQVGASRR